MMIPATNEINLDVTTTTTTLEYQCIQCNIKNGFLIYGVEQNKPCYLCMICMNKRIIEQTINELIEDSKEYKGVLFDFSDKFKA